MDREDFIKKLTVMTHDELNEYIKNNGKKKEMVSYNVPWYIDMDYLRSDSIRDPISI